MLVTAARRLIKDYAPVPKDAPKNQTPKLSKCPICSSDVATLRILTECGHTVCEECARKIVDKTCNDKCPVCRQVDDIDEPASRDVGPSAPVEELEDNRPENRPVCKQETIVDETEKVDIPASSDVGPSAPVEELEDHRPENRTPLHCECPICTEEYSDTVIPRILTQCGHTVCEECARKLLGHQGNITCPVCREETNVDGRVENLPKNFAVIEMARGN
ncbi:hypothetical protein GCK72_011345 [Caenorhabditis remanei]|uniref:RING-type domain-containing protein n=1 Tax=Caenorhabditis remanei TaxID=31234 RepID=A0A6A5H5H7_CAERE|nr:hypothetical protein GCK72_011345 [Caenorhabditis remanei]KAF1763080.1 hypothetical protein GCK72_011345 [Caenorhabditis remanei]